MFRIGAMIRSAKMKATTPPKLIPPFHRTTASGTLPTEQTNDTIAPTGPISGPQILAASGCPAMKNARQNESGTQAAMAPAASSPMTRSRRIAAHSITNTWATAVYPSRDSSRCRNGPSPWTDMSMAAWPSIEPARPRPACWRASRSSFSRRKRRKPTASTTIMTGPPANSATVNCQPISRARITPSSMTRLVEAISNAMAAVKLAPLRNSDRASATAAYEHEDEAAPRPAATASVRGRSSPSSRTIVDRRITACTTADSANPRISAQAISHVIDPAIDRAWMIACMPAPPAGLNTPRGYLSGGVKQGVEHHPDRGLAVTAAAADREDVPGDGFGRGEQADARGQGLGGQPGYQRHAHPRRHQVELDHALGGPGHHPGHEPRPGAGPLDHLGAGRIGARGQERLVPEGSQRDRFAVAGRVPVGYGQQHRVGHQVAPLEQRVQWPGEDVVLVRHRHVGLAAQERGQRLLGLHLFQFELDVRSRPVQCAPRRRDHGRGRR